MNIQAAFNAINDEPQHLTPKVMKLQFASMTQDQIPWFLYGEVKDLKENIAVIQLIVGTCKAQNVLKAI